MAKSNESEGWHRWPLAALLAGLVLAGIGGGAYWRYRRTYLRLPPQPPSCAVLARRTLRHVELFSGSEPHDTPTGDTVYLTPNQDRAVRCASMVDRDLGKRLAVALAEPEPERRAAELVEVVRPVSRETRFDAEASAGYDISIAAMDALPQDLPGVRAASAELDQLQACRFNTRMRCATRPAIPALVWAAGAAGVLALATALTLFGRRAIEALRRRRRAAVAVRGAA